MVTKGHKEFLYCVKYLDKQSWKCEYFTNHCEATNFCFALKRSPDLIKSVELFVIVATVEEVISQYRYEA